MQKIRWGILGTMWIADAMVEAIQSTELSAVLGVASRSETRAQAFADKYGIKHRYSDHQQLLDNPDIDAVYIGLPNHLHKEWIIRCAKAGKHILCEKPFVLNAAEAEEALAAVKKHQVFCMEALMYRCHPFIEQLRDLIASGVIGEIKCITAAYTANIAGLANTTAGGAIRNLGCYPLSLTRTLLEDEPLSILSTGQLGASDGNDHVAAAILTFKNGVTATITTADNVDMHSQFTVYGSEGVIDVLTNPWLPDTINQVMLKTDGEQETLTFHADKMLYAYQIDCAAEHISRAQLSPQAPAVTWEHSLGNAALIEAWLKQVKQPA